MALPNGGMGWSSVYGKGISWPYPSDVFPWVCGSRCGPVHEIVMLWATSRERIFLKKYDFTLILIHE